MILHINIDGAARGNPGPASLGVVVNDPAGKRLGQCGRCLGAQTNNTAEYEALLEALRLAEQLGGKKLVIRSDSQLWVRQFNGQYRVKQPHLQQLHSRALQLARKFESVELVHVPREENQEADLLANEALDAEAGKTI